MDSMQSGYPYEKKWYTSLNKSSLTPPNYIFGIVWPILYVMMTISALLIFKDCKTLCIPLIFFIIQLIFNLLWSPTFFNKQLIGLSLLIIINTLIFTYYTIYLFYDVNKIAAYLLIPYALWITFASYLNFYIYIYN